MVVAGPGTGKTHLLAHRVARILEVTDADPSNILCLTFSEAGVAAMRKRLKSIIGIDANKIHIFTFHGFCNKVILENQDFMGVSNFNPAVDLERMEIIRDILVKTTPDNPLNKATGRVYLYERHLAHLFSWLKRENQDWKRVEASAQARIEAIETDPEFQYKRNSKYGKAGEPNKNKIAEEQERMQKLIAGLNLFEAYQKTLSRRHLYDYDDMIQWVLAAFDRGENLLRRYQEQYLYILVDEFQDTNGSQYALVKKLADFWEIPNLFIVGDDDQSIFEFQGARLHNISDFVYQYSPEVIILDENYRSTQEILDAAAKVIGFNQIRLSNMGYDKNIKAATQAWAIPSVLFQEFETQAEELSSVIDLACGCIGKGTIAILYSKHRQVYDLIKVFQNLNVPFTARYTNDVFRTKSWKYLSSFMEYVIREVEHEGKGDYLLFEWMHFPMFGMSRRETVELARAIRIENANRAKTGEEYTRLTYFESVDPYSRLGAFCNLIVRRYYECTLIEWFDWVVERSGVLSFFKNDYFELSVIRTLYHFIAGQVEKRYDLSLSELFTLFTGMQENSIPMRVEVSRVNEGAIEICSAHAAKGLEWDSVIMFDCSSAWEPGRGYMQFKLPPDVTFSGDTDADEAARRAFYVAMTRARSGLWLTRSRMNPDGKERKAAQYWDEAGIEAERPEIDDEMVAKIDLALLGDRHEPDILLPQEQIDELIDHFILSPTSLNDYLTCPLTFYYKHLLGVPYFESDSIQFGFTLHEPLATLFRKSRHNEDRKFHSLDYFLEWYRDSMAKNKSKFTREGFKRLLPYGEQILTDHYNENINTWPHYTQAEYRITNINIGSVPCKGVIDRMDFTDFESCKVRDYKTGRYRKEDFAEPSEDNPNGGKYWRQLCFYKLLVDRDPKESWVCSGGSIIFVEPQDGKNLEIEVDTTAGSPLVEGLIVQAWDGIKGHNFSGCKDPECKFCNL